MVAAANEDVKLWVAGVPTGPHRIAAGATREVGADLPRFQPGGVGRGDADPATSGQEPPDGGLKQRCGRLGGQEAFAGLLKRGVMGHATEADDGPQIRAIGQQGGDAAIVGFEERLEDQAGEDLMLGIRLGAEAMGVRGYGLGRDGVGGGEDGLGGLACGAHTPIIQGRPPPNQGAEHGFSTEQIETSFVLRRAKPMHLLLPAIIFLTVVLAIYPGAGLAVSGTNGVNSGTNEPARLPDRSTSV